MAEGSRRAGDPEEAAAQMGAGQIGAGQMGAGQMGRSDGAGQIGEARGAAPAAPRYSRRLSDKILIAFHQACDQADFDIAESLLHLLEVMLRRRPLVVDTNRRRTMESLVAAHERLWYLRHPGHGQD